MIYFLFSCRREVCHLQMIRYKFNTVSSFCCFFFFKMFCLTSTKTRTVQQCFVFMDQCWLSFSDIKWRSGPNQNLHDRIICFKHFYVFCDSGAEHLPEPEPPSTRYRHPPHGHRHHRHGSGALLQVSTALLLLETSVFKVVLSFNKTFFRLITLLVWD